MKCNLCINETDNTSGICDNHNKWQKVCPICGKSFETKYVIKKYCCSRCCYKANYKYGEESGINGKTRKAKKAEYACQSCGGKLKKSFERTIYKGNEYAVWRCHHKGCGETILTLNNPEPNIESEE